MLIPYNLLIVYFLIIRITVFSFSPDLSSFDAYGLKLAGNDVLLVESLPYQSAFSLRLSPFNYSLVCTLPYDNSNQYVYAVAVPRQVSAKDSIRFVFIGVNTVTDVPFIGSLTYTGVTGETYVSTTKKIRKSVFPCNGWQQNNYRIHHLDQVVSAAFKEHINNEFYIVSVAPTGGIAYAFAKNFLITYDLNEDNVSTQLGNLTWPDSSFLPHAIDVNSDLLFVVLGFVGDLNTQYTPCAYLLNLSNSTLHVLDTWLYTVPSNTSWQASLTNQDAETYSAKYDMSVSMNNEQDQVLLGIPIVNTIILLTINRTTNTFNLPAQTLSNGKAIGMGKAVGWLDVDLAIVLVNTYSFNYIWSSSQIFVYNVSVPNSFLIEAILPNIQQTFVPTFGPELLSLVVTQNGTVTMLDARGNYYMLLPSPAGSFSDSNSRSNSAIKPCMGGTFSSQWSILPCSLCPTGSTTNGLIGQSSCTVCNNNTFCPLGAASGNISLSSTLFTNIRQVFSYPESPQVTRFDNILIHNMLLVYAFSSRRCLAISPLFWAIIIIILGIIIWFMMLMIKYYIKHPHGKKTRHYLKSFFKTTDLIGEGEMVVGGLFSFAIIVLVIFASVFSHAYFYRYPIEQITNGLNFACDSTLSNAQFESGLLITGIPPNDIEVPIFTLLNEQSFTLYIEFINTLFKCADVSATQIKDTTLDLTISSCNDSDHTVSIALPLPSHGINLHVSLSDTNTIGGLRMRLEGSSSHEESETFEASYTLDELYSAKTFFVSGHLLAQQPSYTIQLTKVINHTYPLSEQGKTHYNAIWLPTFSVNLDQMFIDESEYIHATTSNPVLSIAISETPYYHLNTQRPITDEAELIFTNLLFAIVCLEIFGLGFLLFKLVASPLLGHISNCCCQRTKKGEIYTIEDDSSNTTRL